MKTQEYKMLVIFTAKKGKEQELKNSLITLTGYTLKETGCINYDLHESTTDSGQFMIYETWTSKDTHANHDKSPHVLKWRENRHVFLEENKTKKSIWKYIN